MRALWAALRTTPRAVNWVTALSLVILLGKIIWLNPMRPLFASAHDLGLLVEALLGANVAAYIFFIISYQLPKVIEKQRVGPALVTLAERAAEAVLQFPRTIQSALHPQHRGAKLDPWQVAPETLKSLFAGVRATADSTSIDIALKPVNWFEVMIGSFRDCRSAVDELWRYAPYIDADLASRLYELRFSDYWRSMEWWIELTSVKNRTLEDVSLEGWSTNYFVGYQRARELKRYCVDLQRLYRIT